MLLGPGLLEGVSAQAGFAFLRDTGNWYDSEVDGTSGTLVIPKPTIVADDFLIVFLASSFRGATANFPISSQAANWTEVEVNDDLAYAWRVATGDSDDDFSFDTVSGTNLHLGQMASFGLDGVHELPSFRQGGNLISSSQGSNFPVAGQAALTDNYCITFHLYKKSAGVNVPATGMTDTIDGGDADAYGNIGVNYNNTATYGRSMWMGWTYRIHDETDKAAISNGDWQQTESPNYNGGSVDSYTFTIKFT
jgi:hypothetical protein